MSVSSGRVAYPGDSSMAADFGTSGTEFSGKSSNLDRRARGGTHVRISNVVAWDQTVDGNRLSVRETSMDSGNFADRDTIGLRAACSGPDAAATGDAFEGEDSAGVTPLHELLGGWKEQ